MKPGDRVRYVGPTAEPTKGGAEHPVPYLQRGAVYTVKGVDEYAPRPLIELVECPRKRFHRESFAPAESRREVQLEAQVQAEEQIPTRTPPEPEPASPAGDVLTVPEVARFLRLPKSTVYKLAGLARLPAIRVGKHWRFLRSEIERWLREGRCG